MSARCFIPALVLAALVPATLVSTAEAAPRKAEPTAARDSERHVEKTEAPTASDPIGRLLHATPAQVRARYGDPDVSRAEGKGAFWTYRMPHCALFLFFQDEGRGLHVSGASTGPRKRGESAPTVEACLAQAIEAPE